MRGSHAAPRARILDAADTLFYERGVRSVSVEDVVGLAGTTRMTLYRHFTSKDDLVVQYLRARADRERAAVAGIVAGAAREEWDALLDLGAWIEDVVSADGFRGCPFLRAAAEFGDPGHPVRRLVAEHRAWYRERVARMVAAAGVRGPDAVADRLVLLRDGAMVGGALRDVGTVGALRPAFAAVLGTGGSLGTGG
ncbi:TetR/AcrR family transcriptional regulator [Cellulomonas dongxiuzhuiae]|uniref:TetR/AcrR family transcriptional regulator n=1 Tax=Cellulomonas dongxiuzhuiae TaxID=2819979 RepID=UPI0035577A4D